MRQTRWRGSHSGLTLLEMLVTLVLVSMISGVLWQAMQQLARVERGLQQGSIAEASGALRQEWLRQTLESVTPLLGQHAFEGDEQQMKGWALDLPGVPEAELGAFQLAIEPDRDRARGFRLVLEFGRLSAAESARRVTMLEWSGMPGAFAYVDDAGEVRSSWRAADLKPGQSRIPRAIIVQTGHERFGLLVASMRNSGAAPPSRRVLEKL